MLSHGQTDFFESYTRDYRIPRVIVVNQQIESWGEGELKIGQYESKNTKGVGRGFYPKKGVHVKSDPCSDLFGPFQMGMPPTERPGKVVY